MFWVPTYLRTELLASCQGTDEQLMLCVKRAYPTYFN